MSQRAFFEITRNIVRHVNPDAGDSFSAPMRFFVQLANWVREVPLLTIRKKGEYNWDMIIRRASLWVQQLNTAHDTTVHLKISIRLPTCGTWKSSSPQVHY